MLNVSERAELELEAKVSKAKIRCRFHTPPCSRPEVTQLRTLPSGGDGARDVISDHPSPGEGPEGL